LAAADAVRAVESASPACCAPAGEDSTAISTSTITRPQPQIASRLDAAYLRLWQRRVTGDARNNYRPDAAPEVLRALHDQARAIYWLNPEPRADWDTTDSIIATYAGHCDGVCEVRNLRQLEAFVGSLR